jgi:septal ring factor EnvC (AmiA/AmiB activator)
VGAQTEAESRAQLDAQRRIGDALAAELQGVRYRLREAETALSLSTRVAPAAPVVEPVAVDVRADQALADLGRTAERLAATEESLRDLRTRLRSTESELAASRREQAVLAERVDEASAQLDERDRREAAAEFHRREQLVALQDRLASAELRTQSLRELVASVRSSVSAILADGRGALVAHDLLQILRAVESSDGA